MKLLILLSFVIIVSDRGLASYITLKSELPKMTADEQLLTQYSTECISEAGKNLFLDPKQAKENNYPVDADLNAVKDISRCMMVKFGVIDPEGKVNNEGAAKYVSSITGLNKDEATEIVKKCAIVTGTDNEESAIKLIECAGKTAV